MANTRTCSGTNKDGSPCSATARAGSGYCPWHDPAFAVQRQRWKSAAGRAKSNRRRASKRILAAAMDLTEVDAALCGALRDILAGELEPNIGTAAASIARTITALRTATDHEERLARLEAELVVGGKGIA